MGEVGRGRRGAGPRASRRRRSASPGCRARRRSPARCRPWRCRRAWSGRRRRPRPPRRRPSPGAGRSGRWSRRSRSASRAGRSGICLAITRRTLASSSIRLPWVCRRPAVSTMTTSAPRARAASIASKATAPGSAPGLGADQLGAGPLGPLGELLGGGGAVGVGGGEDDREAELLAAGARRSCRSSSSCRCR